MRYALISDVHANLEGLTSVLRAIDSLKVDQVICLGDIVGYHANPNECIALLKASGAMCIAGNHDRAATGQKETLRFGAIARQAINWTKERLSDASRTFLRELPSTRLVTPPRGAGQQAFFCVHGALHPEPNDDLHLSTAERVGKSFEQLTTDRFAARVCFFGHTHHAVVHEWSDGVWTTLPRIGCTLESSKYYLVNPGSVGQSRERNVDAAFLTMDSDLRRIEFHRVSYDIRSCLAKAQRAGLLRAPGLGTRSADWLIDKLDTGRSAAGRVAKVFLGPAR